MSGESDSERKGMVRVTLAIDQGKAGAIAVCLGGKMNSVYKMPETTQDVVDLLKTVLDGASDAEAYIEDVGGYLKDRPQPGAMMFSFGRSCGVVLGALTTLGVRIIMVRPQMWQKALGIGTAGMIIIRAAMSEEERKAARKQNAGIKAEWKRKLKERAQQLYPDVPITLQTADAMLILEYGKRTSQPPLSQPHCAKLQDL
jgi:hypothetical protein